MTDITSKLTPAFLVEQENLRRRSTLTHVKHGVEYTLGDFFREVAIGQVDSERVEHELAVGRVENAARLVADGNARAAVLLAAADANDALVRCGRQVSA